MLLHTYVLIEQRGLKHRRIIGVDGDHQSFFEVSADRVGVRRRTARRPQIARVADLDGDLPLCKDAHQVFVMHGGERMADAFRADVERCPNGFRAHRFSRVRGETQTAVARLSVKVFKQFSAGSPLVSADPDADHVAVRVLRSEVEDALRRLDAEMPHRVEYPQQRYTKLALS